MGRNQFVERAVALAEQAYEPSEVQRYRTNRFRDEFEKLVAEVFDARPMLIEVADPEEITAAEGSEPDQEPTGEVAAFGSQEGGNAARKSRARPN